MTLKQKIQEVNSIYFHDLSKLLFNYEIALDNIIAKTDVDKDTFNAEQAEVSLHTMEGYTLFHVISSIDNLTNRMNKQPCKKENQLKQN